MACAWRVITELVGSLQSLPQLITWPDAAIDVPQLPQTVPLLASEATFSVPGAAGDAAASAALNVADSMNGLLADSERKKSWEHVFCPAQPFLPPMRSITYPSFAVAVSF